MAGEKVQCKSSNSLTPWSRIFLEKLIVTYTVNKSACFTEYQNFHIDSSCSRNFKVLTAVLLKIRFYDLSTYRW
jgi:hypothetical protein